MLSENFPIAYNFVSYLTHGLIDSKLYCPDSNIDTNYFQELLEKQEKFLKEFYNDYENSTIDGIISGYKVGEVEIKSGLRELFSKQPQNLENDLLLPELKYFLMSLNFGSRYLADLGC